MVGDERLAGQTYRGLNLAVIFSTVQVDLQLLRASMSLVMSLQRTGTAIALAAGLDGLLRGLMYKPAPVETTFAEVVGVAKRP